MNRQQVEIEISATESTSVALRLTQKTLSVRRSSGPCMYRADVSGSVENMPRACRTSAPGAMALRLSIRHAVIESKLVEFAKLFYTEEEEGL